MQRAALLSLLLASPLHCLFGHVQFPNINTTINSAINSALILLLIPTIKTSNTVVEPGDHHPPPSPGPGAFHSHPVQCSAFLRSVHTLTLCSLLPGQCTEETGGVKVTFGTSRERRQRRGCQLQGALRYRRKSPLQMQ